MGIFVIFCVAKIHLKIINNSCIWKIKQFEENDQSFVSYNSFILILFIFIYFIVSFYHEYKSNCEFQLNDYLFAPVYGILSNDKIG